MAIPKISAQDTILKAGNAAGETKSIPVPKGTYLRIDVPGLHYNSTRWCMVSCASIDTNHLGRYWEDPHTFKPSRFLEDWPRDAFMPLSAGRHWNALKNTHLWLTTIHAFIRRQSMPGTKVGKLDSSACYHNNSLLGSPRLKELRLSRCWYPVIKSRWKKNPNLLSNLSRRGRAESSKRQRLLHRRECLSLDTFGLGKTLNSVFTSPVRVPLVFKKRKWTRWYLPMVYIRTPIIIRIWHLL